MHSSVISKALANQKIRKMRQAQHNSDGTQTQARNSMSGHGGYLVQTGDHSFSQELTQTSSDPLNNTTMASEAGIKHHHVNSQLVNISAAHKGGTNFDSLIPILNNAKQLTQKKLDSNLFTLYRQSQQATGKKYSGKLYTNRFDSSLLNNSLISIGAQDYTPGLLTG